MNKFKITKAALKMLIASASAAFGSFVYAFIMWYDGNNNYSILLGIGTRLMVFGIIAACTYDLIKRQGE